MNDSVRSVLATAFPEVGAGGYTRMDGSVEFYTRVQSLLRPDMRVLDYGAGRAQWFEDDVCAYRRQLRQIKGKVRELVACDVDPAVLSNRSADAVVQLEADQPLPFATSSFDLIVADYVFEHVQDPQQVANELERILAPGGWLCARTPNALGYVALCSRLIHNKSHVRLLNLVQPNRKAVDVFPTVYRLNTLGAIEKYFPAARYDNCSYRYDAEPAYFFGNRLVFTGLRFLQWLLPPQCSSQLFVFLRRRGPTRGER
jgi:SAM-dependent methyltransferase